MTFSFVVTIEDESRIEQYGGKSYDEVLKLFGGRIDDALRTDILVSTGINPGRGLRVEALPEPGKEN